MKRRRVPLDVSAKLAVTFASLTIAQALAELLIEVLLRDGERREVGRRGNGRGNFVVRWLPRCLMVPCA